MTWQNTLAVWKAFEALDPALKQEIDTADEAQLEDAFASVLNFGTAGMRGVLGAGPNRMNRYTVRQATEGLAKLIIDNGEEAKKRGVAIAYDSRHFSPEFAMESALVLAKHGIKSYVYESLRPTPVLSFAVRYLNAFAGIMITASHNPAAYNGYKVYGADGGQMPPEDANHLTQYVRAIENPLTVEIADKTESLGSGLVEIIGDRVDQAYLKEMQSVTINPELVAEMADKVNIVFTPLHGTGMYLGMKALVQAGFTDVKVVEEQSHPDGDFPTVKSPNPESDAAFDLAEVLGRQVDADILLATDPDADRLGAKVKTSSGSYELITGNQIAALMLDYLIQAKKAKDELVPNSVAVKSIVSTKLADAIMEANGLEMVEVLTGFKFIAEKIHQYELSGEHTFLMGFEESYGYLIKPFVRDKDAIQALVVLAELTAYHKQAGKTLADALHDIYGKYGYFYEKTISLDFPGLSGQAKMAAIMEKIRQEGIQAMGGLNVEISADYLQGTMTYADGKTLNLSYPESDALKYTLEDGSWVAFRPSGTEPKIKLYLGTAGSSQEEVKTKAEKIEKDIQALIDNE
ncbi:phospho-sugar mutase [Tuanshanicoccus lijuaniae]|uniref:phospho-sugar mutase n=1 Tax=Aerococcaceae bacterium zg-1292 TaxID=2774330 RepID=UPI001BD88E6F|nr:phospho-sugar mutase [Aerococcaceae bacterium zg-A91]MBS4458101.1 phospho-sugar mutase [Aerococcaceae bacterium zg-BR33]